MLKFAVFTDLHYDHIPDGQKRVSEFIEDLKQNPVDFIINLGDFLMPTDENRRILSQFDLLNIPVHHVLGNHDADHHPRQDYLEFLQMKRSYYSFTVENVTFIALDTSHIKTDNGYIPFDRKNYRALDGIYPVLPEEQIVWLQKELDMAQEKVVILSHHSLENPFGNRGVQNRQAIQEILMASGKKIYCLNGHDHANSYHQMDSVHFMTINAMSYIWLGSQCHLKPYAPNLYDSYPWLHDIVLYDQPLYGIVTINTEGFHLEGRDGGYRTISLKDLGLSDHWNGRILSSSVNTLLIK